MGRGAAGGGRPLTDTFFPRPRAASLSAPSHYEDAVLASMTDWTTEHCTTGAVASYFDAAGGSDLAFCMALRPGLPPGSGTVAALGLERSTVLLSYIPPSPRAISCACPVGGGRGAGPLLPALRGLSSRQRRTPQPRASRGGRLATETL